MASPASFLTRVYFIHRSPHLTFESHSTFILLTCEVDIPLLLNTSSPSMYLGNKTETYNKVEPPAPPCALFRQGCSFPVGCHGLARAAPGTRVHTVLVMGTFGGVSKNYGLVRSRTPLSPSSTITCSAVFTQLLLSPFTFLQY